MPPKQVKPTKAKKNASPGLATAVQLDDGVEAKVKRSWDGKKVVHLKTLGKGVDASAFTVRLKKCEGEIFTFVMREEEIKHIEDGEEPTEADVAQMVRHLANHRKVCEHPFVVAIYAWTVVERDGKVFFLTALPECKTTIAKLLDGENVLAYEYRCYTKLFVMHALMALDHLHANDVTHRDLHTDNVFIDVSDDGEKRLLIGDFGQSIDWSKDEQVELGLGRDGSRKSAEKKDLVRIAELLPFAERRALPKTKEEQEDRKSALRVRKTLSSGTDLKPREVVLLNWFQGPKKALDHPAWAIDIATKKADGTIDWKAQTHSLLANVSTTTLKGRLKEGGCNLRLVNGVSEEGGIDVQAHVRGELEGCLYPWGFTCSLPGGGRACPVYGLMTDKQFAAHRHETPTGGAVVVEEETDIVALSREDEWRVLQKSRGHIDVNANLVYSTSVARCTVHDAWADITVLNVDDKLSFAHQCVPQKGASSQQQPVQKEKESRKSEGKDAKKSKEAKESEQQEAQKHWLVDEEDKTYRVRDPVHLAELVKSNRSDWSDPCLNFYQLLKKPCNVEDHYIAQRLRENGITWQEPTPQAVLQAVKAAFAKAAAKKKPSADKKDKSGGGGGGGKKKKSPPKEKVDVAAEFADLHVEGESIGF